ncbi:hypothetical protein [Actinomadura spongiicola]|nr:hypothetical protein [Actinomadura spongiicola]
MNVATAIDLVIAVLGLISALLPLAAGYRRVRDGRYGDDRR